MYTSIKSALVKKYISIRSWKTNRRILVIESDDWGSERSWDSGTVRSLIKLNPDIEKDRISILDSIASQDDLSLLFDLLNSIRDKNNNSAVITANVCTANPDFDLIAKNNFQDFFYVPFYESIKKRTDGEAILTLWENGIRDNLFFPQLHGREHLHSLAWLNELRHGNKLLHDCFHLGVWGIPYRAIGTQRRHNLQAALDNYGLENEFNFQLNWIREGSQIFKDFFGFESITFIPPAYTWSKKFISHFRESGIKGVQGISLQYEPLKNERKKYKLIPHINGQMETGQIYRLSRNAYFEPYSIPGKDWVNSCLAGVNNAFLNMQPAVIGCHRVNFIGVIDKSNRDENLTQFLSLLKSVKKKWPDVEFLNSAQLLSEIMH